LFKKKEENKPKKKMRPKNKLFHISFYFLLFLFF